MNRVEQRLKRNGYIPGQVARCQGCQKLYLCEGWLYQVGGKCTECSARVPVPPALVAFNAALDRTVEAMENPSGKPSEAPA